MSDQRIFVADLGRSLIKASTGALTTHHHHSGGRRNQPHQAKGEASVTTIPTDHFSSLNNRRRPDDDEMSSAEQKHQEEEELASRELYEFEGITHTEPHALFSPGSCRLNADSALSVLQHLWCSQRNNNTHSSSSSSTGAGSTGGKRARDGAAAADGRLLRGGGTGGTAVLTALVPPKLPASDLEDLIKVCFEGLGVTKLCLSTPQPMAVMATGMTTATAVDIGWGGTCVAPIVDGRPIPADTLFSPRGGALISSAIARGLAVHTAAAASPSADALRRADVLNRWQPDLTTIRAVDSMRKEHAVATATTSGSSSSVAEAALPSSSNNQLNSMSAAPAGLTHDAGDDLRQIPLVLPDGHVLLSGVGSDSTSASVEDLAAASTVTQIAATAAATVQIMGKNQNDNMVTATFPAPVSVLRDAAPRFLFDVRSTNATPKAETLFGREMAAWGPGLGVLTRLCLRRQAVALVSSPHSVAGGYFYACAAGGDSTSGGGNATTSGSSAAGITANDPASRQAILNAANNSMAYRRKKVVLCGGPTLAPGVEEQFIQEVGASASSSEAFATSSEKADASSSSFLQPRVQYVPLQDRLCAAWVGGSIVSQLNSFDKVCATSQTYFEEGPRGVLRSMHST